MMKVYTIYKIENQINNKHYIGFDSHWPTRARNHKICSKDRPLYKAIKKYGIDNFSFEPIYQSKDHVHTLNEMENYFIKEYKSHISENGYNLTFGGEGNLGWKQSEESKKKIIESNTGKKRSKETCENIRKSKAGVKRKSMSEETKKKIGEKAKLRTIDPKTREAARLSLTGRIVSEEQKEKYRISTKRSWNKRFQKSHFNDFNITNGILSFGT